MTTSLQEISSCIPSSVLSNLKVLEATGNLPKTAKKLTNALKPFTSAVVFNSPTAVLKELSRNDGAPSFQFLLKEHLKIDEKLDQKASSYAQSKATAHNALLREGNADDVTSLCENLTKSLRAEGIPTFFSVETLEAFVAQICTVTTEIDSHDVVRQLKELQLITTDLAGNVTYPLDSQAIGELLSDETVALSLVLGANRDTTRIRGTQYMETDPPPIASRSTVAAFISQKVRVRQNPVLKSALKCLQKLDDNLPKTEQKLANVLKPICKLVCFCKPTDVLKRLDSKVVRRRFCAVQTKTFGLSLTNMFSDTETEPAIAHGIGRGRGRGRLGIRIPSSSEPSETVKQFQKVEKWLLMRAKRANAGFLYGTQFDNELAVKRVKEWLVEKQSIFQSAMTESSNASSSVEAMETGATTTSTETNALSTKPILIGEFLHLCISHTKLEPAEVVERLKALCIIAEDEDGEVSYNGIPLKQPNLEETLEQYISTEKAAILKEQMQQGGITVGHIAGIKRGKKAAILKEQMQQRGIAVGRIPGNRRGRLGQRRYKKPHFS